MINWLEHLALSIENTSKNSLISTPMDYCNKYWTR